MQNSFHKIYSSISKSIEGIDTSIYIYADRKRRGYLPLRLMLSVLVYYSYLACRSFKTFVQEIVPTLLREVHATNISYNRWCVWRSKLSGLMQHITQEQVGVKAFKGVSLVDSTGLPVCAIQRERDHKCHSTTASKTMTSLGWMYGYKLHIITSENGLILRWALKSANVHDVSLLKVEPFTAGLTGILMGDSAYTSTHVASVLAAQSLSLVVKPKKKQLSKLFLFDEELAIYGKRWKIETVIGALKEHYGLRLSKKTRSFSTFMFCVCASLYLYQLLHPGIA